MPICNDRVSSTFDLAHRVLFVDIGNGREKQRSEISFAPESDPEKVNRRKTLNSEVLICGAILCALASKAYLTGKLMQSKLALPGCWPGARKGLRRGRRLSRTRE